MRGSCHPTDRIHVLHVTRIRKLVHDSITVTHTGRYQDITKSICAMHKINRKSFTNAQKYSISLLQSCISPSFNSLNESTSLLSRGTTVI